MSNGISPCACDPPTPGIVTFDPDAFKVLYPAFASIADAALNQNFTLAQLLLNNGCCSAVCDAPTRSTLLNLIVAHVTQLLNGANGDAPGGLVGRIASAAQGSVSVSAQWASTVSMSEAYWSQTQYGAMFWQAAAPYRSAFYSPSPEMCAGLDVWDAWPQ